MIQQEADRLAKEWKMEELIRLARISELEQPPHDSLRGFRLHAWVVILPTGRDVIEPIFIEPSTGRKLGQRELDEYLGLESIWNGLNYWVSPRRFNRKNILKFSF